MPRSNSALALLTLMGLACSQALLAIVMQIEIATPVVSSSLSGVVIFLEDGIPDVLVERLADDRETVVDSVVTDTNGSFSLRGAEDGKYTLGLSQPGFATYIYTVVKTSDAEEDLRLEITIN